jgi:signal transduction histidine kinase/ligand-binding sensor domain-containing protein
VGRLHISRSLPVCFLLLSFAVSSGWALDPGLKISQYGHTAWRVRDGAFGATPNTITQTKDGYLWIGTQSALLRFDGVRFVPWTPPGDEQLPSSRINSLLGAGDGSLWIGTTMGLARWKDGKLTNYHDKTGSIETILEDRNGTIWVACANPSDAKAPLCEVTETGLRCYGKAEGMPLTYAIPLAADAVGNFWTGGGAKLSRWSPSSSSTYVAGTLNPSETFNGVEALVANPDGSLWVGIMHSGRGLGLQQFVRGAWRPFVTAQLDGSTLDVTALLLDRENSLWIGTSSQGIYRIHDRKVDHLRSADGLSSDAVNKFYEDREGNIWVATSEGIDEFHDVRVVSFSTQEGLNTDRVNSVLASTDGTVWIGNLDSLDVLRLGTVSHIRARDGLPGNEVTSLLQDRSGRLWIGVDEDLSIYEQGKFRRIAEPDGRPLGTIVAITEDVDSSVWAKAVAFGTTGRIVHIQDFRIREEISPPQIPPADALAADPQGGIWLGLSSGDLARYRHGQLEVFAAHRSPQDGPIRHIFVNSDGSVFASTRSGLIGWRNGTLQILGVRNGLPCDSIYAFLSDRKGALWLYTSCGLIAIPKLELQKWWESPEGAVKFRLFDAFDGAQPMSTPFSPTASRSPDGRLWFANENVLQMIDPDHLTVNPTPPPVHVEGIVADRENFAPRDDLRLPPLTRDLEIDYTGLSLVVPQKVRFRYMLEGRDVSWQEPGTRRQAFYNDLSPGKYRFHVIACNNDGVWNEQGATLDFSIAPAWFQTKWFLGFCVLAVLFLIYAFYRLRVRQVADALSARFDERLAERTRMARELHDTFLQTIQGSKLVADNALKRSDDPQRVRRAVEQLSVWLGQATEEGRAVLNSLRTSTTQKNDLPEAFQRATEECRLLGSAEAFFSVTGDAKEMHPVVRDELYRVGYEAIRNARTHSSGNRLEVELKYGRDLALHVKDNGVGIDPTIGDHGKEGHFGLQGMRERVARIGGKLTVASSASSGTEITVVVPGGIVFREPSASPLDKIRTILRRVGPSTNRK